MVAVQQLPVEQHPSAQPWHPNLLTVSIAAWHGTHISSCVPGRLELCGEVWRACLDMSLQADGSATPTGGQLHVRGTFPGSLALCIAKVIEFDKFIKAKAQPWQLRSKV